MQGAWKVGLLVVVFGSLLLGAYWILGKNIFEPKTLTYYALFVDAGGITEGSPVTMAGVNIGHVKKVELAGPRKAQITLSVFETVKIPDGSVASVPTALIGLGTSSIAIIPPEKPDGKLLNPLATIKGVKLSPLDGMFPDSKTTLKELNATLIASRKLLEDKKLKDGVETLLATANKTAENVGILASSFNSVLNENRKTMAGLLSKASTIVSDIKTVSGKIANYAQSGKLEGQVDALMGELNQTIVAGRNLIDQLTAFVNDPNLRQPMAEILANTKTMTDSGTRVAANAEVMSQNGITLTEKAIEIAEKASALADEVQDVIGKFKGAIDKFPKQTNLQDIKVDADVFRETKPDRWRTDVNLSVPISGKDVRVGLYDAFEANKLNLQIAQKDRRFGTLRYGVYASKPGIGVDFGSSSRLSLTANAFGVNNPQLDLRLRYSFGSGIIGWVGVDRLFRHNAPTIGIGIRR